ncbi:aminoglycoside phosphotransferase family protein [Paenibacillus piri]|uniref:Aminoglycoside phosphotransferase family protein n=2 Tax=Paenibacillus piri TaxID=2547395 RepID=A0A4R5KPW3_9BACL|nr:aminoglycoside phosphotransferase family protein [Paenibacillus piri]
MLSTAETMGLTNVTPIVLSDGGNLNIHLTPYPVVARLAAALSEEDSKHAHTVLDRELRAAHHLDAKGVQVLLPCDLIDAGPYDVDGTWMTLWNYVPPTPLQPPSPSEAVDLVNRLSIAMKDFDDELPVLGVWERTCRSAARLKRQSDPRIQALLQIFHKADERMRSEPDSLVPCHGDAHARNLIPGPEGWIWMDFEDVSLMPAYWDLASFVCNLALFGGFQEPTFKYMLGHTGIAADPQAFGFAMTARTLMSVLGNLDFALEGHGDLAFANRQLEHAEHFLIQLDLIFEIEDGI